MSGFEVTRDDRTRIGRTVSFNSTAHITANGVVELAYTAREAFKPQKLVIGNHIAPNFILESIKIDDVEVLHAAKEVEVDHAYRMHEDASPIIQAVQACCFLPDASDDFHWPLIRKSVTMRARNISASCCQFSATFLGYVLRD